MPLLLLPLLLLLLLTPPTLVDDDDADVAEEGVRDPTENVVGGDEICLPVKGFVLVVDDVFGTVTVLVVL